MSGAKGKKRQSKRKQRKHKASGGFSVVRFFKRAVFAICLLLCLGLAALLGVYFFGPFERRTQIEELATGQLYTLRSAEWMPDFGDRLLATIEDKLPGDEGYAVDAGELARDGSHVLAGVPLSRKPYRILKNSSYITLYDTAERQPLCVALHLTGGRAAKTTITEPTRRDDPRVPSRDPGELQLGQWAGFPLAPLEGLSREHGKLGFKEANLTSNLVPMKESFAEAVWQPLLRRLSIDYPRRFEEVWLGLGPVYRSEGSKLSSGAPLPDAYFAIVFDQTDAGALRAISFLVPADASRNDPAAFLSSMERIESLTGLQFLPELRPHTRQNLAKWTSPRLW